MNTCDCGRPALDHDHFCSECREIFDREIFSAIADEAREEQEAVAFQEDPFKKIHPAVRAAVISEGGGFRTIYDEEPFFQSREFAEEWAAAQGYQGGYIIGIVVVFLLPDGRKVGLTTTANHVRAHEQALVYLKAHSECEESHGTMWEAWEIGFLPESYN